MLLRRLFQRRALAAKCFEGSRSPGVRRKSAPVIAMVMAGGLACFIASALSLGAASRPAMALELVMFEEMGCYWCERWNKDIGVVYQKTKEGKRAPLRRVDINGKWPADVRHLYPVNFTPTFVLIEGNAEIGRILGYPGEDFFWPLLDELLKKAEGGAPQEPAGPPARDAIRLRGGTASSF